MKNQSNKEIKEPFKKIKEKVLKCWIIRPSNKEQEELISKILGKAIDTTIQETSKYYEKKIKKRIKELERLLKAENREPEKSWIIERIGELKSLLENEKNG